MFSVFLGNSYSEQSIGTTNSVNFFQIDDAFWSKSFCSDGARVSPDSKTPRLISESKSITFQYQNNSKTSTDDWPLILQPLIFPRKEKQNLMLPGKLSSWKPAALLSAGKSLRHVRWSSHICDFFFSLWSQFVPWTPRSSLLVDAVNCTVHRRWSSDLVA